jgi:hypothetical protein
MVNRSAALVEGNCMAADHDVPAVEKEDPELKNGVKDEMFVRRLRKLKELQDFLYQEAIPINEANADAFILSDLGELEFDPHGRMPTVEEWRKVEKRTQAIFRVLTPALRRKFLMGGTPWMVAWLPLYFLGLAICSLVFAMIVMNAVDWPEYLLFLVYLVWLISLGAIGASASIGMNALSIQDDITFDLTDLRLMSLRVALGALFGVVLSLPFGFPEFLVFCKAVWKPSQFYDPKSVSIVEQAVFLLLPFIFGFSTSLVILVLTQLADAVQAFLGRRPSAVQPVSTTSSTITNSSSG